MGMTWLKLRRGGIRPVDRWIKDGIVLQMTALPDSQLDAMELLRFYQDNPSVTIVKDCANDDVNEDKKQNIWAKVSEILAGGEK